MCYIIIYVTINIENQSFALTPNTLSSPPKTTNAPDNDYESHLVSSVKRLWNTDSETDLACFYCEGNDTVIALLCVLQRIQPKLKTCIANDSYSWTAGDEVVNKVTSRCDFFFSAEVVSPYIKHCRWSSHVNLIQCDAIKKWADCLNLRHMASSLTRQPM